MVSPNRLRICSSNPVSPPTECSCVGGVRTTAATPSGFAPGSVVKSSGERVLP